MTVEGRKQAGTILLMVLILTAMVIAFLVSGVLLSGRQYNATVEQEQEEQSFHAAEAGIHYVLFLLNNDFSTENEFTLVEKGFWPRQTVYQQDTNMELGTYDLLFAPLPNSIPNQGKGFTVYSLGRDLRGKRCQLIRAEMQRVSTLEVVYGITIWDHQSDCSLPQLN